MLQAAPGGPRDEAIRLWASAIWLLWRDRRTAVREICRTLLDVAPRGG